MMIDADVVYLSPATVYRILSTNGVLGRPPKPSMKGTSFKQPKAPHSHWHIDFTYLNLSGTFHFLCAILDGYSRAILSWDIAPTMTSEDAQIVLQRARDAYPDARPKVISDNGKQFVGREFTSLLKTADFTRATTSPYYPQSNGKIERFNGSLKNECIYPTTPLTIEDAKRVVSVYVDHYNNVRLHSATGYVLPAAVLEGRRDAIHEQRDKKLAQARLKRIELSSNQNLQDSIAA
jgi:transposase InsO family protein